MLTSRFSLRRHLLSLVVALLAIGTLTPTLLAPPRPSMVPLRWELKFDPGELRLFVDPVTNDAYWYFTYVVTNLTGQDQIWAPSLVLYTDAGEILSSGRNVPERVTLRIREMLRNDLLETQFEAIGDLLQGVEHAKDGLVVWPADRTDVNRMTLFVGGISGETARVMHPATGEAVILRKTLAREYLIRGDAVARGSRPAEFVKQEWVMR